MPDSITVPQHVQRLLCPLCNANSTVAFEKYGYAIRDCDECQHRFAGIQPNSNHVSEVYDDSYFFEGGAGYPDYLKNEFLLRRHGRRLAGKLARFTTPSTLLDVGCAAGFILRGFQDAGWTGEGIEPNRRMAEHAAEFCGVPIHAGSLADYPSQQQFDLVSLVQVIAHFDQPLTALQLAVDRIRPGGFCLVETWNLDSWSARLLGTAWHEYSPPSVLHWFRFGRLSQLFQQLDCQRVGQGRLVKWITGQHGKSLLSNKLPELPGGNLVMPLLHLIPDHVTCPYLSDDLGWLLFQKHD